MSEKNKVIISADYSTESDKSVLSVYNKGNFIGAIENTSAAFNIVHHFVKENEALKYHITELNEKLEAERKKVERLREALSAIRADMRKMCEGHSGRKIIRGYFERCDKVLKETESGE